MNTIENDLVGKKITKINANEKYLQFETDAGVFTYTTEGDCCSKSLFYDFYGVKNLLNNGVIKSVKEVKLQPTDIVKYEWREKDKKSSDELIQVYGYQITTESPEFGEVTSVFSFRNYSNGYYGGWIENTENVQGLPELTDDTEEIKNETN